LFTFLQCLKFWLVPDRQIFGFYPRSSASVNGNIDKKKKRYKSRWVRSVTRIKRLPKIMLKYRPNGQRRIGRTLKRLRVLYEAESGLSRLNSWGMIMMTTTTTIMIMMLIHKNVTDDILSQNSIISLHWIHKFSFNHSVNPHSISNPFRVREFEFLLVVLSSGSSTLIYTKSENFHSIACRLESSSVSHAKENKLYSEKINSYWYGME
jgi:hypothetical protein